MVLVVSGGSIPPMRENVTACLGLSGCSFSGPSSEDEA